MPKWLNVPVPTTIVVDPVMLGMTVSVAVSA